MSRESREAAWTDYWSASGVGAEGGCLPKAMQSTERALARAWQEAARDVPRKATVLDLATGDGTVLRTIRAVRPDLRLVGVDSAASLPKAPAGISLKAGVEMEALPFADGSIALATSQFGYEYGATSRIAPEVARILAPGGAFRFVLHHRGSPIVSHNQGRARALRWAVSESGLVDKARALVAARQRMAIPTPAVFQQAPAEGARRFPAQNVASEFTMGLWQVLELGRRGPPAQTGRNLDQLEGKAIGELTRIEALCAAALDAEGAGAVARELAEAGLSVEAPLALDSGAGAPLAWLITGTRPAA